MHDLKITTFCYFQPKSNSNFSDNPVQLCIIPSWYCPEIYTQVIVTNTSPFLTAFLRFMRKPNDKFFGGLITVT